ncbi:methanobactin [Methylosinus sp. Sm6]|nr:methanobactin [Methylosinus sp. Sm6]
MAIKIATKKVLPVIGRAAAMCGSCNTCKTGC